MCGGDALPEARHAHDRTVGVEGTVPGGRVAEAECGELAGFPDGELRRGHTNIMNMKYELRNAESTLPRVLASVEGCRPDDTRGYAIATFAETGWEPSEVEVRDATVPA
uniref:Uncharacterized protein n=1 Tax=Neobacillus citreus TaxID=2833578 RepID=A0A942SXK5_9BACI